MKRRHLLVVLAFAFALISCSDDDTPIAASYSAAIQEAQDAAYEVTRAEYERVAGSNSRKFKGDRTRPVEAVDWHEASAFCRKLGELPQEQAARAAYRLPSEAEWEYACLPVEFG